MKTLVKKTGIPFFFKKKINSKNAEGGPEVSETANESWNISI